MPQNPIGVVVHTLATPRGWGEGKTPEQKREEVRRWHTDPKPRGRGWRGLGYNGIHWIDGQFSKGRDLDSDGDPWEEVGAHTAGQNSRFIGIAMEPIWTDDNESRGDPWNFFTPETLESVAENIRWLFKKFPTMERVAGHNEFARKACPQFHVPDWWNMDTMSWRESRADLPRPVRPPDAIDWLLIQRELKAKGYNPGQLDGIRGAKTDNALAAYGLARLLEG